MPVRIVRIHNAHPRLKLDRRTVAKVIHTLDRHADHFVPSQTPARNSPGIATGELSLAFLTDAALARIHGDFLDDPSTTDVITFEGDSALGSAGEICVSADTASTFARDHGHDFSTELTLYVVHGWLHLAGFDDLVPTKKRRMRAAEARAMKLLGEKKVRPKFTLRSAS